MLSFLGAVLYVGVAGTFIVLYTRILLPEAWGEPILKKAVWAEKLRQSPNPHLRKVPQVKLWMIGWPIGIIGQIISIWPISQLLADDVITYNAINGVTASQLSYYYQVYGWVGFVFGFVLYLLPPICKEIGYRWDKADKKRQKSTW